MNHKKEISKKEQYIAIEAIKFTLANLENTGEAVRTMRVCNIECDTKQKYTLYVTIIRN
jgi:hypothetical protein